jgi:hypothetical protein
MHRFDEIVKTLLPEKRNNNYYSYMGDVFSKFTLDDVFNFFLSRKIFAKFFANDHEMLMDNLKKMKMSFQNEIYESDEYYPCANSFFNNELDTNNKISERSFSSYGYKFYSTTDSKFCFTPSQNIFGCKCEGSLSIIDKNNNQISGQSYTEIERTPISFVFKVKSSTNKFSLFNSKEGRFITNWADEIKNSFLNPEFFNFNSIENAAAKTYLVGSTLLFIGFKLNYFNENNTYKLTKSRVVNTKGEELIDSEKFPNAFPDGTSWGSFVPYQTCPTLNGHRGSGYMQFKDLNNNIGVCN